MYRTRTILAASALAVTAVLPAAPAHATTAHHPRPLPAGLHWRYIRHPVEDCGNMHGRPAIVVWRGNGDMQSALFCPDGTVWPS